MVGRKGAESGTPRGASVGGALRSTLWEAEKTLSLLEIWGSSERELGSDTSAPLCNDFDNWLSKGIRLI